MGRIIRFSHGNLEYAFSALISIPRILGEPFVTDKNFNGIELRRSDVRGRTIMATRQ